MNLTMLTGHIGSEPELRETQTGRRLCKLSVATTDRWYDDGGKPRETTEWHRVVAWGRTADFAAECAKGDRVHVEGKLQTRKWETRDGQTRTTTEVVAQRVWRLVAADERLPPNRVAGAPHRRPEGSQPGARVVDHYQSGRAQEAPSGPSAAPGAEDSPYARDGDIPF